MPSIDIELKPSRLFISLLGLVLGGSVVIISYLSIATWLKVLLSLGTLIYGGWIVWSAGLMKSPGSIIGLQLMSDGSCKLHYPLHTVIGAVTGDSTVTTALCVLRFSVPGKRWKRSCVIFKDSLEQEKYRELLIWLYSYIECINLIEVNT